MTANEIRAATRSATTIDRYAEIDSAIALLASKAEQEALRGELNARTAPEFYAVKQEIDSKGTAERFVRQAAALRAAGYPTGGAAFAAWKNRLLTQGSQSSESTLTELFMDEKLSDEERDALVRLEGAVSQQRFGYGMNQIEAGWADLVHTPAGRVALDHYRAKNAALAAYSGSEGYAFLMQQIEQADREKALRIIAAEISYAAETEQEAQYLRMAVDRRRAELAGEAVRRIVEEHGWETLRAIYQGRDITGDLSEGSSVREFLSLMSSVRQSVENIRSVDAKLGDRVVREVYGRAGERVRERKATSEMQKRLADKMAALNDD
jgi:hypothetical protein